MKHLVLVIALFGLLACSQQGDDSRVAKPGGTGNGGGATPQKPAGQRKNTTDYGLCGSAASNLTSPEGRWEMFESADEFFFKIALEFKSGTLTLRQDCYHKAHRLTAQVTVPASYEQGIIKVLADATDSKKAEDKTGSFDCKVTLVKGAANYGFAGHCLELKSFQGRPYLKFAPQ
ncbi:hypothetical protein AZI86_05585 [Bdellovibrio bacteriovorus]|uniref:Lipoprotein n=1 Tax=Bdellovibrio bacteriovorus TaxID=959 RepID=A0A150WQ49_BDEBC|nr:hypothetical protein [Bdellovibrio bacteriovorus]KYG66518.1 hypothetical protein AZI86_05585 [Bdellovibrio bacteriovorus]